MTRRQLIEDALWALRVSATCTFSHGTPHGKYRTSRELAGVLGEALENPTAPIKPHTETEWVDARVAPPSPAREGTFRVHHHMPYSLEYVRAEAQRHTTRDADRVLLVERLP